MSNERNRQTQDNDLRRAEISLLHILIRKNLDKAEEIVRKYRETMPKQARSVV
jgi:hypothetical protein